MIEHPTVDCREWKEVTAIGVHSGSQHSIPGTLRINFFDGGATTNTSHHRIKGRLDAGE